jgi:hypothetical protein
MLSPEGGPRDDSDYIGKASGLVRRSGGRDLSYKDPPDFSGPRARRAQKHKGWGTRKGKNKKAETE